MLARLVYPMAIDAPISAMFAGEQGADQRGLAHAVVQPIRDPRTRIRHERGGRDRCDVGSARGAGELGALVVPTVHVLHESRRMLGLVGWQMLDHPGVVEPHVHTGKAHVEQEVQVLTAGDKRVEGHAAKRSRVYGKATTAHVIRTRDARARKGALHPTVELDALGPPAAGKTVLLRGVGQRRAGLVVEVAALGEDGQALARLMPQAVQGLLQEIGGKHHFVVVQEHHGVMTENGGAGQAHVANGAIATQGHALATNLGRDRGNAVHDDRRLAVGDERHLERGMVLDDAADALGDALRELLGADEQHDDATAVPDLLEGCQAAIELGARGAHLGSMVICPRRFKLGGIGRPIARYHDSWIHAPSPRQKSRAEEPIIAHRHAAHGASELPQLLSVCTRLRELTLDERRLGQRTGKRMPQQVHDNRFAQSRGHQPKEIHKRIGTI